MTRLEKFIRISKDILAGFTDIWADWFAHLWARITLETAEMVEKEFAPRIRPIVEKTEEAGVPPELQPIIDELKNPQSQIGALLGNAAGGAAAGGIISSTIGPWLLRLQYLIQRGAEQWRFDPLTALAVHFRGDEEQRHLARTDIWDQGVNNARFEALLNAAYTRIKEQEAITLRRRGIEEPEKYYQRMRDLGYSTTEAEAYYIATMFYPSPSDLVTWQAREVFEEDQAARYQLDAELDRIDRAAFYKAGMDDEQIKNYWRAHWEHPSYQQVTEMLHRGLLTRNVVVTSSPKTRDEWIARTSEGESLLYDWYRLVETTPFWRPGMTAIGFTPLTRVDVRRMHKIGVLSRDGVYSAYRRHGFDDEDAERMTEFTLKYNEAEDRQLTKTDITSSYFKGLIARVAAEDMLTELGYTAEDIDILLTQPSEAEEESERRLTLTQLRSLYDRKLWPKSELSPYLEALGYSADTIKAIYTIWDWEAPEDQKEATRDLTLTHLKQLYQTGLRPKAQVTGYLASMGYDPAEITDLYLLWDYEKPVEAKEAARDLTLSHVKQLYQAGLRSEVQVVEWLRLMGYADDEITALRELWDWEKEPALREPSRADVDRFLTNEVITLADWVDEYHRLGYDDKYVQWYFADLLARGAVE